VWWAFGSQTQRWWGDSESESEVSDGKGRAPRTRSMFAHMCSMWAHSTNPSASNPIINKLDGGRLNMCGQAFEPVPRVESPHSHSPESPLVWRMSSRLTCTAGFAPHRIASHRIASHFYGDFNMMMHMAVSPRLSFPSVSCTPIG
jgi:hypothetical protein